MNRRGTVWVFSVELAPSSQSKRAFVETKLDDKASSLPGSRRGRRNSLEQLANNITGVIMMMSIYGNLGSTDERILCT